MELVRVPPGFSDFLPQYRNMHVRETGNSELILRADLSGSPGLKNPVMDSSSEKVISSSVGEHLFGVCKFSQCLRGFPQDLPGLFLGSPLGSPASSQKRACEVNWELCIDQRCV